MSLTKIILSSMLMAFTLAPLNAETESRAIVMTEGRADQVLLTKASKTQLFYKNRKSDEESRPIERTTVNNVYFFRTASVQKALDAYAQGKFSVAQELFKGCKEELATFDSIPGNYSTLSAFYEMESARRSGDLETVGTLFKSFRPEKLINESQKTQVELYALWGNVQAESWDKIIQLSGAWQKKKLPGYQKAQVSYCLALAYQATEDVDQALVMFNEAIALSEFREAELIENSSEKVIEILLADEKVSELTKKAGKIKEEDKSSKEYLALKQAAALATVWDSLTTQTRALPKKYKNLLKVK